MSNIQVRINEKDKEEARKIFDKLGLDMSSAIKLFLKQTTLRKGLPFLLTTENGLTLDEEASIIKASSEARVGKNVSRDLKGKKALEYLKSI